jgi:CNT family concentrative nucleoside transporter
MWQLRLVSFLGLFAIIGLGWLLSGHKRQLNLRMILGGLLLQFALAGFMLKTPIGIGVFSAINQFFNNVQTFVAVGTKFVFEMDAESSATPANGAAAKDDAADPEAADSEVGSGDSANGQAAPSRTVQLVTAFAFGVMPTIIFFSAFMSVLYYLGLMQHVVAAMAWVMRRSLGISGAESLAAAANVFVGQTEAPLVIRPYLAKMTPSELHAVMVGGFATISGGIMAAYVNLGMSAGHLLTASVISAPAALVLSKVVLPETGKPETMGNVKVTTPRVGSNLIEAAAIGATDGMKLAINVVAMLIAFLALIAMADALIGWFGGLFGFVDLNGKPLWSLTGALGYLFAPLAFVMGIEVQDCVPAGKLLGVKTAANEFVAYLQLSRWREADSQVQLSERTVVIMTYALCGFSNLSSIGIQIAGIGGLAPERQPDLAAMGFRAMLAGALACCMTGCVVGVIG